MRGYPPFAIYRVSTLALLGKAPVNVEQPRAAQRSRCVSLAAEQVGCSCHVYQRPLLAAGGELREAITLLPRLEGVCLVALAKMLRCDGFRRGR